jgi:DNA-binding NarL/FixJ family response regulator
MSVRLVTVDAVTLVRLGYAAAVSAYPDIALVGQATSPDEALEMVSTLEPNVVTVDTQLTDGDGVQLAVKLRSELPHLGIVLTGPAEDELIFRALEAGLSAFLPRTATVELLMSAVRHAAVAPASFTAPNLAAALARRRARAAALSPREEEILRFLNTGSSLASIAGQLRLTESTVRTYVARLYDKLGVHNRAQALIVAAQHDLL